MGRNIVRIMAVAICAVGVSCSGDAVPTASPKDAQVIEGLWLGSWGGGERADGVVVQPVIAEMLVKGDQVELAGFRNVGRLTGTVRLDVSAKQMIVAPKAGSGGQTAPKTITYAYEIKDDELTLIDNDKISVSLKRVPVIRNPLANATVELVEASGINESGDLVVTEFTELRGSNGETYYQPRKRSLKTRQATVFVVQETGWKKTTVDEARALIRPSMPVAVAYRPDDRPSPQQLHELWKEMGPPTPDRDAVGQTFARTLRPGTLVFILSARENAPVP